MKSREKKTKNWIVLNVRKKKYVHDKNDLVMLENDFTTNGRATDNEGNIQHWSVLSVTWETMMFTG